MHLRKLLRICKLLDRNILKNLLNSAEHSNQFSHSILLLVLLVFIFNRRGRDHISVPPCVPVGPHIRQSVAAKTVAQAAEGSAEIGLCSNAEQGQQSRGQDCQKQGPQEHGVVSCQPRCLQQHWLVGSHCVRVHQSHQ